MYSAIETLYRHGIITKAEVAKAVEDKLITAEDYEKITGEVYPQ